MITLSTLTSRHAHPGIVCWIGIRPERRGELVPLQDAVVTDIGLEGDHYTGAGKRAVTLIQQEHLPVIASLLKRDEIDPADLRRNIVIQGINLLSLRKSRFKMGTSILEGTGICAPCSRMEETFGHGGYNAVRGHGGITAKVIEAGAVKLGDQLSAVKSA